MKIVSFRGGLGNQLFESCFFLHLKKVFPKDKIFGFYPCDALRAHNGLEVQKWFDIELPPRKWFTDLLGHFFYSWSKISRRLRLPSILISSDNYLNYNALFFNGYWMDSKYFQSVRPILFNKFDISSTNQELLEEIRSSESVAVHVRRGDYLSEQFRDLYGGICTLDYYNKAVEIILNRFVSPHFYFFSDDVEFVQESFHYESMTIVSHNHGNNSFYDLYLMSNCKGIIMANSSFSCWASYLNCRDNNIVICPSRMTNRAPLQEMLLEEWIKI